PPRPAGDRRHRPLPARRPRVRAPARPTAELDVRRTLLLVAAALAACSSRPGTDAAAGRTSEAVPVRAAAAVQKDVPARLSTIGTVEASSTVSVKSQVEGQLARVAFQEGQEVHTGDLLFVID